MPQAAIAALVAAALLLGGSNQARAQKKIFLNPSNQTSNSVSGGGNEAQYALICAKLAKTILTGAGFSVVVDQDFTNAPKNANSWGADIFISLHTNAGGGHGTEVLYKSTGGKAVATKVLNGLLGALPYQSRGLKYRTNLHVLNNTNMYACLTEAVFHDCTKTSGYQGHPPAEAAFLRTSSGQQKIANGTAAGACAYFGKTCSGSSSAKGWLKGVVYKAPDLTARISGAKVTLNTGASVTSDSSGAWSFQLAPGSYTATATMAGYKPNSSTRTVVANQTIWGSIGLTKVTPTKDSGAPDKAKKIDLGSKPDLVVGADLPPRKDGAGPTIDGKTGAEAGIPTFSSLDEGCGCGVSGGQGPLPPLLALLALLALRRRR